MTTLAWFCEPGPMAQRPAFSPIWRASGPLTSTSGAWGPVDMAAMRRKNRGAAPASTAAIPTGRCSGRQPAMTALMAIFSTVARPKPGSSTATTSAGARRVPASMRATRSGVGGTSGKPSLQPRSRKMPWVASSGSPPAPQSRAAGAAGGGHPGHGGRGREPVDPLVEAAIDRTPDLVHGLVGEGQRHHRDRQRRQPEGQGAPVGVLGEGRRREGDGGNAGLLQLDHVVDKPRRARPSIAGRADDRIALGRHPLDIRGGGHAEEAPDLAPVAAEGDAGGALGQELGGGGQGVVPAGFEVPVEADALPPEIGGTRRRLDRLLDGPGLWVQDFEPHVLLLCLGPPT